MISVPSLGLVSELWFPPALLVGALASWFGRQRRKGVPERGVQEPDRPSAPGNVERLTGATETLLIPLWARALEYSQPDPILRDVKAVEMVERIDYPFERFRGGDSSLVSCCLRAAIIDGWVRRFLEEHPEGPVVEMGVGLDTRFERLDNGQVRWFELDLPEVISLRRNFFQETSRRSFISASVTEEAWMTPLNAYAGRPVFFVAEGMLYFLPKVDVRRLFSRLADRLPGCHVAFDSHAFLSRLYSQLFDPVRRTSGKLQWSIRRPETITTWDARFRAEETVLMWDLPQYRRCYRDRLPRGLRAIFRCFPPSRRMYRVQRAQLG